MRITILSFLLIVCQNCCGSGFDYAEPGDSEYPSGMFNAKAMLTLDQTKIVKEGHVTINIAFQNLGAGREVYNPFLDDRLPLPAVLAVYDSNKKYIGDMLRRDVGSFWRKGNGPWVVVPTLGVIGTSVISGFKIGNIPPTNLPPGTYYLQVIYVDMFRGVGVDGKTYGAQNGENFIGRGSVAPFLRSNVVQIELADR